MLTLQQVLPYLNSEQVDTSDTAYLNAAVGAVSDYLEHYTNLTLDANAPLGLVQAAADMITYQTTTRPHLKEMESEDMTLAFNTDYPAHLTKRLTHYRRVAW